MWAPWVKQALRAADDVVLVASPDLASLRNADNIVKLLKSERPDAPPLVVLSMTGVPKRPEIPFKDFVQALGLKPEASFAFDPVLFGAAAMTGQALGEIAPRSKPAAAIDLLASALTGREPLATRPASAAAAPPPLADLIRAAARGDLAAPGEPATETAPLVLSEALPVAPAAIENEIAELEADTADVEAEPITESAEAAIEAELAPELEADTADVEAEPIAESAEAA